MPTYVYECEEGHIQEISRPMDDRDLPLYCPLCNREGAKNLMTRRMTAPMAVTWSGAFHSPWAKKQDLDGLGSEW